MDLCHKYQYIYKWLVLYCILSQNPQVQVWKETCVFLSIFFCDWPLWRYEDEFRLLMGVALLWCNFSSCSWHLLVESKLKTRWFKCHSGEDQQRTVKLGLSYGNMRLSQLTQMCFIWHSLSVVPCLNRFIWKNFLFGGNELQMLTEEWAFGFLVSSVFFSSSWPSDFWS